MAEIILHPIEERHLPQLQQWRNSPNVLPNCRQYRPLSLGDMKKWFDTKLEGDYNLTTDMFLLSWCEWNFIGVGGFVRIDWRNRIGELSFYIAQTDYATKDIITKSISKLLEYAFKTLNLHKVYFPVYSFNPYLEIYEEIMSREYVALREYYWDGEYHDRIILAKYNQGDKCETTTL